MNNEDKIGETVYNEVLALLARLSKDLDIRKSSVDIVMVSLVQVIVTIARDVNMSYELLYSGLIQVAMRCEEEEKREEIEKNKTIQ